MPGGVIEIEHQAAYERPHLRLLGHDVDGDAVHLKDRAGRGAYRADHHVALQRLQQRLFQDDLARYLQEVAELNLASDGQSVNLACDDAGH